MSQPVSIHTQNACVDFPIFDAKSRSLKKAFLGKAGGSIGRNDSDVVVVEALRDITMTLKEGDRIGLVGHNGAGKSTLLRLLSGIYEPTRGSASIRGRVAPVFDLGVGMDPEISGYENIIIRGLFLGQTRKQMLAKMDEIAEFTSSVNTSRCRCAPTPPACACALPWASSPASIPRSCFSTRASVPSTRNS